MGAIYRSFGIVKNITNQTLKNVTIKAEVVSFIQGFDPETPLQDISYCKNPPIFGFGKSVSKHLEKLDSGNQTILNARINTTDSTTQGIYYIQISISYELRDTRITDQGMSSFSVVDMPSKLPLYILVSIAIFFGILSIFLLWYGKMSQ
ncbi:MAG: hypothetical protein ACE5KE_04125 [Methanosarcinales archaeon]